MKEVKKKSSDFAYVIYSLSREQKHLLLNSFNIYFALSISGTTAILSVFTFLFLIPFVVDPAISTIIADYDPVPVTCIVIEHIQAAGIKNCTWSSCREGCTSSPNK